MCRQEAAQPSVSSSRQTPSAKIPAVQETIFGLNRSAAKLKCSVSYWPQRVQQVMVQRDTQWLRHPSRARFHSSFNSMWWQPMLANPLVSQIWCNWQLELRNPFPRSDLPLCTPSTSQLCEGRSQPLKTSNRRLTACKRQQRWDVSAGFKILEAASSFFTKQPPLANRLAHDLEHAVASFTLPFSFPQAVWCELCGSILWKQAAIRGLCQVRRTQATDAQSRPKPPKPESQVAADVQEEDGEQTEAKKKPWGPAGLFCRFKEKGQERTGHTTDGHSWCMDA